MLTKRIIPCLDVTAGRVVKGVNFVELRDAGDPVEIARRYDDQGADELTFLDITASSDQRDIILHVIEAVADQVFIPLTVGGGVRAVADVRRLLNAGADKVSINTAAIQNPRLVAEASGYFGAQCIVVAIDAKSVAPGRWEVFTHGGRNATGLDAIAWAREVERLGAGEILLTSMDRDGTRQGFDLPLTRAIADAVGIPVIASGGVGNLQHLADGVSQGRADAVLAASIFHFGEYTVRQAKQFMADQGIPVRLDGRHVREHTGVLRRADARDGTDQQPRPPVAGVGALGRQRPGDRDRAGGRQPAHPDGRVDEPRRLGRDGRHRPCGVLVALARAPVAQGRGVGPRAAGARDPARL